MAVWFLFNELAVFVVLLGLSTAKRDLLDTLQIDQSNPPELNEFLKLILHYKDEFRWIRQAALKANLDGNGDLYNDLNQQPRPSDFSFLKRSIGDGSPENDVYPYVYSNSKINGAASPRSGSRNFRVMRRRRKKHRGKRRQRRSNISVSLNADSEQDSGEVNVVPRSEIGVQSVPGNKYGSKHYEKREEKPQVKQNIPADNYKSKNISEQDSEYYDTSSHDVLGLAQDLTREFEDRNMTCVNQKTRNPCRNAPNDQKRERPQHIVKTFQTHKDNDKDNNLKRKLLLSKFLIQTQHHIPSTHPSIMQQSLLRPSQNITVQTPVEVKTPKMEELDKLWNYAETPQKTSNSITKEELLKDEGDDVLGSIDRLLKSDRSGLKMYRDIPSYPQPEKRREDEVGEKEDVNVLRFIDQIKNFNNFKAPLKRIRNVNAKELVDHEDGDDSIDVELRFNSEPQEECEVKEKTNAKKRNGHKHAHKARPNINRVMIPLHPPLSMVIDSDDFVRLHQKHTKGNVKATTEDQDISQNLKSTVQAYENRQSEYKTKEKCEDTMQNPEKQNMLEDQSEPTSAAEQRELAKQDEFVTPSMDDNDTQALIVIPLKKAANSQKSDYDTSKDGAFKVKESKDVIHIKGHRYISSNKDNIKKKETKPEEQKKVVDSEDDEKKDTKYDAPESQLNALYTKEVFDKVKGDVQNSVNQNDYTDTQIKQRRPTKNDETIYENTATENDKLDPSNVANLDYDYYENFDQKREAPSVEAVVKFQSRQLKSAGNYFDVDLDYRNGNDENYRVRKRRFEENDDDDDFDQEEDTEKRSEDEESDEDPGNDSKKASYKKKTKEEKLSEFCNPSNTSNANNTADNEGTIKFELTTTYSIKLNDLLNKTGFGSSNKQEDSDECIPDVSSNSNGSTGETNSSFNESSLNGEGSGDNFEADMDEPTFGSYGGKAEESPKKSGANYNYFNVTINLAAPAECETTSTKPKEEVEVIKKINSTKVSEALASNEPSYKAAYGSNTTRYFFNENKFNKTNTPANRTNTTSNVLESPRFKGQSNHSFVENGFNVNCFDKNYLSLRGKDSVSTLRSVVTPNSYDEEEEIDNNDKMHDSGELSHKSKPSLDKNTEKEPENYEEEQQEDEEDEAAFINKEDELLKNLLELVNIYSKRIRDFDGEEAMKELGVLDKVHGHGKGKKKPTPTKLPPSIWSKSLQKGFPEKRVLNSQVFKELQEGYYEPESMADDLKQRLLVEKLYNAVMKKRRMNNAYLDNYKDVCLVDLEDKAKTSPRQRKYDLVKKWNHKRQTRNQWRHLLRRRHRAPHMTQMQNNLELVLQKLRENSARKRLAPKLIKKEAQQHIKLKMNDVDSFKDVIEHQMKQRAKRSRSLEDFTESYLSPLRENNGIINYRKRRRLKYLDRKGKVARQVNTNHYFIKNANIGGVPQKNVEMLNFIRDQNSNVEKSSTAVPKSTSEYSPKYKAMTEVGVTHKTKIPCSKMGNNRTPNCTEIDALRFNQSLQLECDEKIREHEEMRKMLSGSLALKLIDVFLVRLKNSPSLYSRFGKYISKTCAEDDVKEIKNFREEEARGDIKHAEEMLHEVIVMLNKIVSDQVSRKTCLRLAPNLKTFVVSITKNFRNLKKNNQLAEGFPLPKIKSRNGEEPVAPPAEEEQGNFLFESPDISERKANPKVDVNKKIKLIEKLLDKYQRMSMNCQVQVEPVKNYLTQHLNMLMQLLEKSSNRLTTCITTEGGYTVNVKEQEIAPPLIHHNKNPVLLESEKLIGEAPEPQSDTPTFDEEENLFATRSTPEVQLNTTLAKHSSKPTKLELTEVTEQPSGQTEQIGVISSKPQSLVELEPIQTPLQTREEELSNMDQFQVAELEQSGMAPMQAKPPHTHNLTTVRRNDYLLINSSDTTESIVANQLQSGGKFSNPELVNKNLISLGLGGANSYLPPFDINGMVQEGMIKSQMGQTAPVKSPPRSKGLPNKTRRTIPSAAERFKRTNKGKGGKAGKIKIPGSNFPRGGRQHSKNPILFNQQQMGPLSYVVPFSWDQPKAALPFTAVIKPMNSALQTKRNREKLHRDIVRKSGSNEKWIRESAILRNATSSDVYIQQPLLINPMKVSDPCIEDREPSTGKKYENPQLVNRHLSNLGLNGANSYRIPFNLNTVVQNRVQADTIIDSMKNKPTAASPDVTSQPKMKNVVKNQSPDGWIVSDQYRKLVDTVESLREKRQNEERIGKLFSRRNDEKNEEEDKLAGIKSKNKELQDLSKVKFEKPLVFSIEN